MNKIALGLLLGLLPAIALAQNIGPSGGGGGSGSGTVTSVSVVTANGISGTVATSTTTPAITLTPAPITVAGQSCALGSTCGLATASNAIASNISIPNTTGYTDGPSMAQGTAGTWWATGTASLANTTTVDNFRCKLWDGTTIISSGETIFNPATGDIATSITLSGFLASPAANIRISCRDVTSTSGNFMATVDGASNTASKISGFRIN